MKNDPFWRQKRLGMETQQPTWFPRICTTVDERANTEASGEGQRPEDSHDHAGICKVAEREFVGRVTNAGFETEVRQRKGRHGALNGWCIATLSKPTLLDQC
jgi:hypothetical protein